jgi:hypothetical protein
MVILLMSGAVSSLPLRVASASSGSASDQVITVKSPNAQALGAFGSSVAMNRYAVVVGAPGETAGGYSSAGNAYVFNATTGALITTLTSPNAQTNGCFGQSVAISGSTVVVGAYCETADGYSLAGNAYVFNATTGALINTLTSPNAQTDGYFGESVAISGDTAVVGAYGEAAGGYSVAGNAYVFNATTGALINTLTSPNAQTDEEFGSSVAISASTAVVGTRYMTANVCFGVGNAYVFNAMTGALIATLMSPNVQTGGCFGFAVAISGSTVVVGAFAESARGHSSAGNAYVFNATTGAVIATLTSPNAQTGGEFGYYVAISGSTVVVGAYAESAGGYCQAGHSYVFNATTGALVTTLTSPRPQEYGDFAEVAISGNTTVVGAHGETAGGYSFAGNAYVFSNVFIVTQPISASFVSAYGGSPQTVTITGCSPTPSSFPGDGSTDAITMSPSCAFTLSLPSGYVFVGGTGTTTCSSGTCSTYTTSYEATPITQPISASFVSTYGGTQQTITIGDSCFPTPSSFPGDGSTNDITMAPSCAFTLSLPSGYQFVSTPSGTTTCSSGTCTAYTTTYEAIPPTTVTQPISATFNSVNGGSEQTITITRCSPSPSSFAGDGTTYDISMSPSCSFGLQLPSGYRFIGTPSGTTCASETCTAFTISYEQSPFAAACTPESVVVGKPTTCTATLIGSKPYTGTVTWSTNSSGKFSPASATCKLTKTKDSCSVKYTPSSAGAVTITATYSPSGKSDNPASSGAFSLAVNKATSTTKLSCSPSSIVV